MTFLDQMFASLERNDAAIVLEELRDGQPVSMTARRLLAQVQIARAYLRRLRLKKGDRCALLAHNSIRWVAMDLAIMAEGMIAVPLYARQAPIELVAMMKDCSPALICCGDAAVRDAILQNWPQSPATVLLDDVFVDAAQRVEQPANLAPQKLANADPVAII